MISVKIPCNIFFFLIVLFALPGRNFAQFYNTGQAPASVSWMQIKTEHFQIIYPEGFHEKANKAANLLEYIYDYGAENYRKKPKRISVILYNQSVRANGYVVWAPKRSEWVTTPPQETYVQDWLEQLALHEYRHVVQLENLEQGMTKMLKIIFGEIATGIVTAYLPFWFLEGDAVVNETALSSTGRGRAPDFSIELRALEREKKIRYSYDQSYLGSYKYFVPDYYKYGYHMVSYAKLKYNPAIWRNTIDKVGRRPYLGAPFYFGLRKNGAVSKVQLYHETLDSLNTLWRSETEQVSYDTPEYLPVPKTKHFTNYSYIQSTPYGIFAVKTGINDITRFVYLNNGTDTIIHTPGRYSNTPVSAGQKYVVWEENLSDTRWQQKSYSVIKLLELATGYEKQLTRKSRYFSPALSPSDDKVACIKIDERNQYSIIILDSFNGEIRNEIILPPGIPAYHPVWMNEESLVFITMQNNSKRIEQISLTSQERKILFESGLINISCLYAKNNMVYFTYDIEMSRNIYVLYTNPGKIFRLTNSKYGADYPFVNDNQQMYYSEYTVNGYIPAKIKLDSSKYQILTAIEKYNYSWAESLSASAGINIQESLMKPVEYDSLKYNRLLHSFNFHSWAPFYFDVNDYISLNPEIYPGITLLSQNKLSTITSSFSYFYSNGTHYIKPKITIERFYPVFEISALFGSDPDFLYKNNAIPHQNYLSGYYDFTVRCYLPLSLTRNRFVRYFQPGISYGYTNEYYLTLPDSVYKKGYDYLGTSFYFSNILKKSPKDIYSRFGQIVYISIHEPLLDKKYFSPSQLGIVNLYFPGFSGHHSIRIYLAEEKKKIKKSENNEINMFVRGNSLAMPRGYLNSIPYSKLIIGSAEYTFPLFYPDWSIGPLVYIKRFHASIFYDAAKLYELSSDQIENLVATGFTLASEMHFLRFFIPFTPKITAAYLPKENDITILFGISIETSVF